MSIAEIFLLVWACVATIACGFLWALIKKAVLYTRNLSDLVCELVTNDPDVVITPIGGERYTVENERIKMTFERRGNHGIQK